MCDLVFNLVNPVLLQRCRPTFLPSVPSAPSPPSPLLSLPSSPPSLPCPFLALPLPLSFLWIASLLILIAYALPCLSYLPPPILSYLFLPYLEEKCETLPCG